MIDPQKISLRDLTESDLSLLLDYWFRSPIVFFEKLGVDWSKMPPEAEMKKTLLEKLRENENRKKSKLPVLVITYDGQAIGAHTINPLIENDHGIFHAHIWRPEFRRRGIALHTYPQALKIFMERFNLERILFKTPIQNQGAIRVKEKLGIRYLGEETINFSIIKDGTRAQVFEVTRAEIIHCPAGSKD